MSSIRYVFIVSLLAVLILPQIAVAKRKVTVSGTRPYKDIYGNSYKKSETLFMDKDKNGVRNIYQKRDRRQTNQNKRRR